MGSPSVPDLGLLEAPFSRCEGVYFQGSCSVLSGTAPLVSGGCLHEILDLLAVECLSPLGEAVLCTVCLIDHVIPVGCWSITLIMSHNSFNWLFHVLRLPASCGSSWVGFSPGRLSWQCGSFLPTFIDQVFGMAFLHPVCFDDQDLGTILATMLARMCPPVSVHVLLLLEDFVATDIEKGLILGLA